MSTLNKRKMGRVFSMDPHNNTFLHIGDIISLYNDSESTYISSTGQVDDRCVVEPYVGSLDSLPDKFRDCLFRVCPAQVFGASKQYRTELKHVRQSRPVSPAGGGGGNWKEEKKEKEKAQTNMLARLQIAAEREQENNEVEKRKSIGKPVTYGMIIQLQHLASNKYITVNKREPALVERNAMRVTLEINGNDGSWLLVEPFFKYSKLGDNVVVGDCVGLVPYSAVGPQHSTQLAHQLHISPQCVPDHTKLKEVNCQQAACCWRVLLFLQYDENIESILKSGDVVRLFHAERQAFLHVNEIPPDGESVASLPVAFIRLSS